MTNPWIFITLGTSFGNDVNFFSAATQAAMEMGCTPMLALGGQLADSQRQMVQAQLPAEAVVQEQIDLDIVLPHVTAAIHHGGAGVTHALVTHAIPQIVVPHAADQGHQAHGVMRSGVGLHLPAKESTIPRLVNALARVNRRRQAADQHGRNDTRGARLARERFAPGRPGFAPGWVALIGLIAWTDKMVSGLRLVRRNFYTLLTIFRCRAHTGLTAIPFS